MAIIKKRPAEATIEAEYYGELPKIDTSVSPDEHDAVVARINAAISGQAEQPSKLSDASPVGVQEMQEQQSALSAPPLVDSGPTPPPLVEAPQQPSQAQSPKATSQDELRSLLDRYNAAIAERNSKLSSDQNLAAMRAFNYQKAGGNIAARDLYDPSTADGAMKSYNEEMRLGDRQRELSRQQVEDAESARKNAVGAQGDDPNSDYSMATVDQIAESLGRPELKNYKGRLSANQVLKLVGPAFRPAYQETQKTERLDKNISSSKDMQRTGIDARANEGQKQRDWMSGEKEKDRLARLAMEKLEMENKMRIQAYKRSAPAGAKDVEIPHALLVPAEQGVKPSKSAIDRASRLYGSGRSAIRLIEDMESALREIGSKNFVSINTDNGPGAVYMNARAQLVEMESLLKEQGVVREADYKNFDNKIPDISTLRGSARDLLAGGKLMNNVAYMKQSIRGNIKDKLAGYSLREAADGEDLAKAWGGKYSSKQQSQSAQSAEPPGVYRELESGEEVTLRKDQYDSLSAEEKKMIERVR